MAFLLQQPRKKANCVCSTINSRVLLMFSLLCHGPLLIFTTPLPALSKNYELLVRLGSQPEHRIRSLLSTGAASDITISCIVFCCSFISFVARLVRILRKVCYFRTMAKLLNYYVLLYASFLHWLFYLFFFNIIFHADLWRLTSRLTAWEVAVSIANETGWRNIMNIMIAIYAFWLEVKPKFNINKSTFCHSSILNSVLNSKQTK